MVDLAFWDGFFKQNLSRDNFGTIISGIYHHGFSTGGRSRRGDGWWSRTVVERERVVGDGLATTPRGGVIRSGWGVNGGAPTECRARTRSAVTRRAMAKQSPISG